MYCLLLCCLPVITISVLRVSAQAPIMNIEGTTSSIMGKLQSSLTLNSAQQPRLQQIVTTFLEQKVQVLSLQQSNPAAYQTRSGSLLKGLLKKVNAVLNDTQYAAFLKMQPPAKDPVNVLSQLFYM